MGKYALLLMGGIGLTSLIYTQITLNQNRYVDATHLQDHELEVLAREAAMSGYNEAIYLMGLNDGAESIEPVEGLSRDGRYRISFDIVPGPPSVVSIRVDGQAQVGGSFARHVVAAVFRDEDGASDTSDPTTLLRRVPPYMRYAAFSSAPLRFLVLPRVLPNGPGYNADVHTNGNLNLALSIGALLGLRAVEGFGTYSGSLYHIPLLAEPADAFQPVMNPASLASLRATDEIALPAFDVRDWASYATRTESSTLHILGQTQLGTRENPEIIYVPGNLIIADTRFQGYGTFLVEGSVIYEGTVTGALGMLFGQAESRVAFYTNGPVLFNGIGDFQGQILSNSTVTFSGATTLYGSVAARGAINFAVAPTIRFTPPSPALTTYLPNNPPVEGFELLSYREWEVHD